MCAPGKRISEATPRTWQETDLIVSTLKGSFSVNQNPGPTSIITGFFSDLKECRLHCPGHFCSQRSSYGCWPWVRQSRELEGQKGREPKPEGPYGSHQVKLPSPLQMERGTLRPPQRRGGMWFFTPTGAGLSNRQTRHMLGHQPSRGTKNTFGKNLTFNLSKHNSAGDLRKYLELAGLSYTILHIRFSFCFGLCTTSEGCSPVLRVFCCCS